MDTRSDRTFWIIAAVCLLGLGWLAFGETNDVVNVREEWGRKWARVRILSDDRSNVLQCIDLKLPLGTSPAQLKNRADVLLARYLDDKAHPPPRERPDIRAADVRFLLLSARTNFNAGIDASALSAPAKTAIKRLWLDTARDAWGDMIEQLE